MPLVMGGIASGGRRRLRASTDFMRLLPRSLGNHWYLTVAHTIQESRKPKCPRCGKRLATDKAQQCFGCGLCWHGMSVG
jgi:hypothetical protein